MQVRNACPDDIDALRAALLGAFNWEPSREPLPLEHPALAPYRDDWGREGDLGVVAEADGAVAGAGSAAGCSTNLPSLRATAGSSS